MIVNNENHLKNMTNRNETNSLNRTILFLLNLTKVFIKFETKYEADRKIKYYLKVR